MECDRLEAEDQGEGGGEEGQDAEPRAQRVHLHTRAVVSRGARVDGGRVVIKARSESERVGVWDWCFFQ